jgi:hypothetical protein
MTELNDYIILTMWVLSIVIPLVLIILALILKEFNSLMPLFYLLLIGIFTGYITFIPIYALIANDFIHFKKHKI